MRFIAVTILLIISCKALAQNESVLPTPPNTVWLMDNIYIDRTEIANIHWLEYLHYTSLDSVKHVYLKALPDTTVWDVYDTTGTLKAHYLRYPGYRYWPIVGVTAKQAGEYCKWRSKAIMNVWEHKEYALHFRLPNEEEWEYAASGGLDKKQFPYGFREYLVRPSFSGKKPKDLYSLLCDTANTEFRDFKKIFDAYQSNKSEPFFNVTKKFPTGYSYTSKFPWSIINKENSIDNKYPKEILNSISKNNDLGIADMIGNVAELIEGANFAKGGSWAHSFEKSTITNRNPYTKPEAWLGFRCVCEVSKLIKPLSTGSR